MISFLNMPAKIIGILEANISPGEIAFGVCLGMFLGFTPLNGTTALLLTLFFFIFRINRMATLLTLPIFKTLYLLGISRRGDILGSYFLEKADYLTGFWRLVTNLPVIAYLDINRTTVAGGIILSALLSVPVYFTAKIISARLLAKYPGVMHNTRFYKWVRKTYHVSNIIGTNAYSVVNNIKAVVTRKVVSKIKSAIIKPKVKTGIMKRINLTGIAIILVVLILIQVGVGLIISPAVGAFIIDSLNRTGGAKITVERINVWPLTLSFSMKDLKVFDPKEPDKRIARIESTSVHISPIALLSRRLVFSTINMNGTELDLEGSPDGSFNIQRFAASKTVSQKTQSSTPDLVNLWKSATEKRDWFGKIYSVIKNKFSKKGQEQEKNSRKVRKVVQDLPKGKLVTFKTPAETYLFEIKSLNVNGHVNIVPNNAGPIELKNARIALKRVAFDPQNGTRLDGINLRGELFKDNSAVGKVELLFLKGRTIAGRTAVSRIGLNDVDLDAIRFIYEDSLPVHVVKGKVSLTSNTKISPEAIDSINSLTLVGQTLEPKPGALMAVGFIPMPAVCDALNRIDPAHLKFNIKGTVEKPEFGGFQETFLNLVKPYVANIGEQVKTQAVESLKSLFGDKSKK